MLKEILKKLGIEYEEEISDEDAKRLIEESIDGKNEHISTLESERDSLSQEKQELTASVEGYKSREETLSKELSETKVELVSAKAKLEQITDMYKEQFTQDPEKQEVATKDDKNFENDVLQQIIDTQ